MASSTKVSVDDLGVLCLIALLLHFGADTNLRHSDRSFTIFLFAFPFVCTQVAER